MPNIASLPACRVMQPPRPDPTRSCSSFQLARGDAAAVECELARRVGAALSEECVGIAAAESAVTICGW